MDSTERVPDTRPDAVRKTEMTNNDLRHKITTAAELFCRELSFAIPQHMPEVIRKQVTQPEAGTCYTHDFCDANEVMLTAFDEAFGSGEALKPENAVHWDAAWYLAKVSLYQECACRFFATE